jgi:hypothetical protein
LLFFFLEVQGQLACCFWACGETEHHGKNACKGSPHLMVGREKEKEKGAQVLISPSRA